MKGLRRTLLLVTTAFGLVGCGAGVATWVPEPGETSLPQERLSYTIHLTVPAYRGWVFYDLFLRVPPEKSATTGIGVLGISSHWLLSPLWWRLPIPLIAPGVSIGASGAPSTPRNPPSVGGLYTSLNLEFLLLRNPRREALRQEGQILWAYLQLRFFNHWWAGGDTDRGLALELGFRATPTGHSSW